VHDVLKIQGMSNCLMTTIPNCDSNVLSKLLFFIAKVYSINFLFQVKKNNNTSNTSAHFSK